jgi:hypothetical protein
MSKIKHGEYFVGTVHPNPHNSAVIYPKSFPIRGPTDFVKSNKQYD